MIVPPNFPDPDLGDPGSWQDALRWVRFPVLNSEPADDVGRERPDALGPEQSPFHDPLTSAGAQHNHA